MAKTPCVVAIRMGYGHLRPARALADELGTELLEVDRAPLASEEEQAEWLRIRNAYEGATRISQLPVVGSPWKWLVDSMTRIPRLHPYRDQSSQTLAVRAFERRLRQGLGRTMADYLRDNDLALLTTHFAPALVADWYRCSDIYCVVTDTDINRIWAPADSRNTRITYLVPSQRARRRLLAYGVPANRIRFTGFPLPGELLGGPDLPVLRKNLAARLVRLDPEGVFRDQFRDELHHFLGDFDTAPDGPLHVTFAVGGAGAQAGLAARFLPGFRPAIVGGRVRVTLVAGVREEVAEELRKTIRRAGLAPDDGVDVLYEETYDGYFRHFSETLAETDVLWTKPSELTFFGALGIALLLSRPVGVHEQYNRRWAREHGAALKQRDPRYAHEWLNDMWVDGTLAAAAWSGFMRLPKFGLYRILETVSESAATPVLRRI